MTDDRYKLARELLANATPGPWYVVWGPDPYDKDVWGIATKPEWHAAGTTEVVETDAGNYPPSARDAALIAASRELLREALDEIDQMKAELARLHRRIWPNGDIS